MEKYLNFIDELYITSDLRYGYNITYRLQYPDYTKSIFIPYEDFYKVLKMLNEDIKTEIRNRSI